MSVAPGWHIDPAAPETRRYWDGEGWIGAPIPIDVTPPDGPPPVEPESPPPGAHPAAPGSPAAVDGGPGIGSTGPATGAGWPHPPQTGHPGAATPQSAPPHGGPPPSPYGGPPPGSYGGPPPIPHGGPPAFGGPGAPGAGAPPPGWPWPGYPMPPPEPRPHGLALAGLGARLVARLIDFGIVFLLNAVVNGWFVWRFIEEVTPLWREVMRRSLAGDSSTEGLPQPGDQAGGLQVVILLIATALWFAYEVPSTANGGQTFGKRIMRIKVLPLAEGQQLGFGRSFRRWNTLGLPTLLWYCCGFGLLLQLVDALSPLVDRPLRQALHDKRAQTVVVQLPAPSPTGPTAPGSPGDPPRSAPHDRADPPGDAA